MQSNTPDTIESLRTTNALLNAALLSFERENDELRAQLDSFTAAQRRSAVPVADDRRINRTTSTGGARYAVALSMGAPWYAVLTIAEPETMNADELAADWPRLQSAMARYCASARDEVRMRGAPVVREPAGQPAATDSAAFDALKAAFLYLASEDRPKAEGVLMQFGLMKLSEATPDQYSAIYAAIKAAW